MKKEEAPTSNTHHFLVDLNGQSTWVKIDDDRQQRRLCCGSTDVSKIMGTNQYDGQYELYHTKINDEVLEVNSAMRMGLLMEPIFRQLTQESLGDLGLDPDDEVIEGETFVSMGFMYSSRSTPDALLKKDKSVCFEYKRHRYEMRDYYGDPMTNEVAPWVYDQVQWHMQHANCQVCFVGALFGGDTEVTWWRVERDDKRIKEIDDAAMEFFVCHLHKRVEPPADASKGCLERLKRLEEREASRRPFEGDEWKWAVDYDRLKNEIQALEEQKKEAENLLRQSIGEIQEVYLEGGKSKVTLKAPKNQPTRRILVRIKD